MTTATDIAEELLTAYALGELDGTERERVATFVAMDESARLLVESIRGTAELLAWELPAENRSAMLPAHRATIEEHLYGPPPVPATTAEWARARRRRLLRFLATLAASVAVVFGGFWVAMQSLDRTAESAVAYSRAAGTRAAPTTARVPSLDPAASQPTTATGGFAAATGARPGYDIYGTGAAGNYVAGYPGYAAGARPGTPDLQGMDDGPASPGTQSFAGIAENVFLPVTRHPLSAFPAAVDSASSYANVRWLLGQNMLPPPDAVRIEEMVNRFPYAYVPPGPDDGAPFAASVEVAGCPWADTHRLVRIGLKGREADRNSPGPLAEARTVLLEQADVTPPTIARGVRVQVEFNPTVVSAYRLIGYENRVSAGEDFNPDSGEAADVAAGHAVTALYEVIPVGAADADPPARPKAGELRYQKPPTMPAEVRGEMLTVKVRYREPGGKFSRLLEFPLTDRGESYARASEDFKFAAAVASFGMILRGSPHRGTATLAGVAELAQAGLGRDEGGYRAEFIGLVQKTRALSGAR